MSTKFLHYRAFDQETNSWLANCGATIAFVPAPAEQGPGFFAAVAWCGPRDNYSKRLGRAKAGGRLNSPQFRTFVSAVDFQDFLAQNDEDMEQHGYTRKSKQQKRA